MMSTKQIPSINTILHDTTSHSPLISLSSTNTTSTPSPNTLIPTLHPPSPSPPTNRKQLSSSSSSSSSSSPQQHPHPHPPIKPVSVSPLSSSSSTIAPSSTTIPSKVLSPTSEQPRKRSKISRACDACRRKKIKCNADYSQTLQKVTKICTNCDKNKEECLFSRTPLKRGPSKGYIRELEEKIVKEPIAHPQFSNGKSQIILPPIIAIPNIAQKLSTQSSNPSSPRSQHHSISGLLNEENSSPPIQGPFWKVPYEMPQSSLSRKSSITSISSANNDSYNGHARRRSSIDSISSTSTSGSRLLPSIKPTYTNEYMTDSESEEFYSIKSSNSRPLIARSNSQSLSPRNSISSLSSLNARVGKSLSMGTQPLYSIPINPLELNLKYYYENLHKPFPILPFDINNIIIVKNSLPAQDWMVEMFNLSLNNLNNYKQVSLHQSIQLFQQVISAYPSEFPNPSLILFLTTLVLINYTIILNGEHYNQGIAITISIFNDLKIVSKFIEFNQEVDIDHIINYFIKLHYLLNIIDSLNCLQCGYQKNMIIPHQYQTYLHQHQNKYIPMNHEIIELDSLTHFLIENKYQLMMNSSHLTSPSTNSHPTILSFFTNFINEKNSLINYILSLKSTQLNSNTDNEDLLDFNVQLLRYVKKSSQCILNFANNLSNLSNLIDPILNISITQLFKHMKLLNLIIETLTCSELNPRLNKLINELSISFNLLNLNLGNLKIGSCTFFSLKQRLVGYNLQLGQLSDNTKSLSINEYLNRLDNLIIPFIKSDTQAW